MTISSNRMNALEFNYNHTLTDASAAGRVLKAWSERIMLLRYQSAGPGAVLLTIPSMDAATKKTVKIQDIIVTLNYNWTSEITSLGVPELFKHFALEIKGKDELGATIIFTASVSFDSGDGKSWSKRFGRRMSLQRYNFS
jgi:hypothetical protein